MLGSKELPPLGKQRGHTARPSSRLRWKSLPVLVQVCQHSTARLWRRTAPLLVGRGYPAGCLVDLWLGDTGLFLFVSWRSFERNWHIIASRARWGPSCCWSPLRSFDSARHRKLAYPLPRLVNFSQVTRFSTCVFDAGHLLIVYEPALVAAFSKWRPRTPIGPQPGITWTDLEHVGPRWRPSTSDIRPRCPSAAFDFFAKPQKYLTIALFAICLMKAELNQIDID